MMTMFLAMGPACLGIQGERSVVCFHAYFLSGEGGWEDSMSCVYTAERITVIGKMLGGKIKWVSGK